MAGFFYCLDSGFVIDCTKELRGDCLLKSVLFFVSLLSMPFFGATANTVCPENSTNVSETQECICDSGYTVTGIYGDSVYATTNACKPVPKFNITTTKVSYFEIYIRAKGTYTIDWGDGTVEHINKTDTYSNSYYHSYGTNSVYNISISGKTTDYSSDNTITFGDVDDITALTGQLGAVFGTLPNGKSPNFYKAYVGASNLTTLSSDLFIGIDGSPDLFYETFRDCTALTEVPEGLFDGITTPAASLLQGTFKGCSSITKIPSVLTPNVTGSAPYMFWATFQDCSALKQIPPTIFSNITESAHGLFRAIFAGCDSLTEIPQNLFAGITQPASELFIYAFSRCYNLKSLPNGLFKNIKGKPANQMFYETFANCSNMTGTVPVNLFENLSSQNYSSGPMYRMFYNNGLSTKCPANTVQYQTGFERDWNGKVACTPCPSDTVTHIGADNITRCLTPKTLHIGDDVTMKISPVKPSTTPAMVFGISDAKYYGGLSKTPRTINKNTNKKFRIFDSASNNDYWLYDYTE